MIEQVQLRCDRHGTFMTFLVVGGPPVNPSHFCDRCADARNDAEGRARRDRAEQRMRQERLRELQSVSQIPKRYVDTTFDDFNVSNAEEQLALAVCTAFTMTWAEQSEKGGTLLLLGPCGTGKTMLACAVANTVIAQHMSTVCFGAVSDYCREVRSTFSGPRGGRSEAQVMQSLRKVDLLVIDDIGAGDETAREIKTLFDIIDGRWRDGRPTVVTSNFDVAQLHKHLGQRAMDRLLHNSSVVAFNGDSHRGKVALS